MRNLLPTELWQYSLHDLARGLFSALYPDAAKKEILIPGLGRAIPIRSARASIIVALRALDMRPGSKIGVPLYCCPVVFKAIRAAGCHPRFLDIDPETFCLSLDDLLAKRREIDAVISVHMFGNLCEMSRVLEVMEGAPVIEDCAQSVGSKYGGQVSGSFGHISFFSFRSGKYLSAGEGGALFSNNAELFSRLSKSVSVLPAPTPTDELKHIIMTYVRSKLRSRPLWGPVGSWLWSIYNRRVEFVDKSPIDLGQIYASDLSVIRRRMPLLDSMIAVQRANADFYERNLQVTPSMLCHERPESFYNRFMYPIAFPSAKHRDITAAYLQSFGISTAKPYEEVIRGAAEHYGYEGDCPAAENALKKTMIIPNHFKIKLQDREHIVHCANKGWARVKGIR